MTQLQDLQEEINKVVKGKENIVKKVLAALLANGHVLMDDIPGVGKTTLAMCFAKALSLDYKRIQFTPDVLPSDILGFSMLNAKTREFEFKPGAVFSNLLLADEINRTSPKTQSALLEVMEEQKASIDGVTRELPKPFFVIATQNPLGSAGTQMLPDSQLDRFMICVSMGYPSHEEAVAILKDDSKCLLDQVKPLFSKERLLDEMKKVEAVYVHDAIYEYIVSLVEETRTNVLFRSGASPRGSIALLKMSKAMAYLNARDFVALEDVQSVCKDVLGHRTTLSAKARSQGITAEEAVCQLFQVVKAPRM